MAEDSGPSFLWPNNAWQFFSFLILLAAIAGSVYYYVTLEKYVRDEINQVVFHLTLDADGNPELKHDFYQVKLWTPTAETHEDVVGRYGDAASVPSEYEWQLGSSREKNAAFLDKIFKEIGDKHISGARWFKVEGMGDSRTTKRGQWWVITVKSNVSPEPFYDIYSCFWDPSSKVYMEVLGKPGYLKKVDRKKGEDPC